MTRRSLPDTPPRCPRDGWRAGVRFIRFALVGGTCALLASLEIFVFTHRLQMNYLIAAVIAFVSTNYVGHLLNRRFTFAPGRRFGQSLWRYFAVAGFSLGCSLALMALWVQGAGLDPALASLVVSALFMVFNFLSHSYWTYASNDR